MSQSQVHSFLPAARRRAIAATSLKGVETVLMKFHFTNPNHLPSNIRLLDRPSEEELNKGHVERAKTSEAGAGVASLGRVRFGKRDNGVQWANNVPDVCPQHLQPSFDAQGFNPVDAHVYIHSPQAQHGRKAQEKWVLVVKYNRKDIPAAEGEAFEPKDSEALVALLTRNWGFFHGWNNVTGGAPTITLNFLHVKNPGTHRNGLIAQDGGQIEALPYAECDTALDALQGI